MKKNVVSLLLSLWLIVIGVYFVYESDYFRYIVVHFNEYVVPLGINVCMVLLVVPLLFRPTRHISVFSRGYNHFSRIYGVINKLIKKNNWSCIIVCSLFYSTAIGLFLIPTFSAWNFYPNDFGFFGIFPRSDGPEYYGGALKMLYEGNAEGFGSARPLIYLFFAVFFALSNGNAQMAMLLQSLFIGSATLIAAKTVAADFGRTIGVLFFIMILGIAWPFTSTFMTEGVGLALAITSFGLLWIGLRGNNVFVFSFGLFILTIGQNVRSGAMFVIPCIAFFSVLHFVKKSRHRNLVLSFLLPFLAVVFGFTVQMGGSYISHGNFSIGQENGIYTLYSLVRGEHGWRAHVKDNIPSNEVTRELIFNEIRENPGNLISGIMKRGGQFITQTFVNMNRYLPISNMKVGGQFIYYILCALSLLYLVRYRNMTHGQFIVFFLAGYILSGPILGTVAFNRVFVSSAPFIIMFFLMGLSIFKKQFSSNSETTLTLSYTPHVLMGLLIVLIVLAGPFVHLTQDIPDKWVVKNQKSLDQKNEISDIIVRLDPGVAHIEVVSSGSYTSNIHPDFLKLSYGQFKTLKKRIPRKFGLRHLKLNTFPSIIALTYALEYEKKALVYLVGSHELLESSRIAMLHGKLISHKKDKFFYVEKLETLAVL